MRESGIRHNLKPRLELYIHGEAHEVLFEAEEKNLWKGSRFEHANFETLMRSPSSPAR